MLLIRSKPLTIPEKIKIKGSFVEVVLEIKSKRTSSCSLRRGRLILSLSSRMSKRLQQKTADELLDRMVGHLEKTGIKIKRRENYRAGQKIKTVFGNIFVINIDPGPSARSRAYLRGENIYIKFSAGVTRDKTKQDVNELVRKIVSKKEQKNIEEYVYGLNKKYFEGKLKIGKVSLKKQESVWGSCSKYNNINLSFKLLFKPEKILEYICVHEMCHILHHNHSRSFWQEVEKILPDYKTREKWLRKNN